MRMRLPEAVKHIIGTLQEAGFEAYAVGGCVRDTILGREPDDWDITTSARPERVKKVFRRTVDTGIAHGTVTVLLDGKGYEVTTYRIDGEYEDARHPKEVIFTPSLQEDLKRRDFTMNAMAYNDKEGLVDLFDGRGDMERGMIRCVGNPEERFGEDALRIMRAVRFSAQLGYTIEDATGRAIERLAPTLAKISAERIQVELTKLVTSPHPEKLRDCYAMGITAVILPEFDRAMETKQNHPHHCYSVGEHILHAMQAVEADKVLRLTMLFHDIGKPACIQIDEEGIYHFKGHPQESELMARKILRRLKYDNDTVDKVCRLVKYHDYKPEACAKAVRRAIHKIGEDIFPLYLKVRRADVAAQSDYLRQEKLRLLDDTQACYERILEQQDCLSLKSLAVTGSDLIAAGMEPGRQLGAVLAALLELVLEDPERNRKEYLLEAAKDLKK